MHDRGDHGKHKKNTGKAKKVLIQKSGRTKGTNSEEVQKGSKKLPIDLQSGVRGNQRDHSERG